MNNQLVDTSCPIFNVLEFLSAGISTTKKFAFGCNETASRLAIYVDGFVDDFRSDRAFTGKPVIRSDEVPERAVIVNCALCMRPRSATHRILQKKSTVLIQYATLMEMGGLQVPVPDFVEATRTEVFNHPEKFFWLHKLFDDHSSRAVLRDVLRYRLTCDTSSTISYHCDDAGQYFDPRVCFSEDEFFLDCGAYQGETTEEFLRRVSHSAGALVFEPSPENLATAKRRLASHKGSLRFLNAGVSDCKGRLRFLSTSGIASRVDAAGDIEIDLVRIDDVVDDRCTFIKMDIEGHELLALNGAQETIRNFHPKLAIACYHSPDHFWKIPELVLSFRPDYDCFLRHYSEGWADTVMYFLPKRVGVN